LLKELNESDSRVWETVMEPKLLEMLSQLFQGVGRQVGSWPKSRAVYGVDWIPVYENEDIIPKLIEVNYCPDFTGITNIYPGRSSVFFADMYTMLYCAGEKAMQHSGRSTRIDGLH